MVVQAIWLMSVDVDLVVERMGDLVGGSGLACQCLGPALWCVMIGLVVLEFCMDDVHGRYGCGMTG